MVDPLSLAVGAVIFAVGYVSGRVGRAHRTRKPADPYVCGCQHHFAVHDPKTNACNASVYRGGGYGYKPCACKQYVGERPLDLGLLTEQAERARRSEQEK